MITENPDNLELKVKEDFIKWWGNSIEDESFPFYFMFMYFPQEVPLSEIYSDDSALWRTWKVAKEGAKSQGKIPMLILYNCESPIVYYCFAHNHEIATVVGDKIPNFVAYSLVMKGMPNLCAIFLLYDLLALDKKLFEGLKPYEE